MSRSFKSFLSNIFPQPRYLRLDSFGIDVSASAIRVISLIQKRGKLLPILVHERILSAPNGTAISDNTFVSALSDIGKKFHIQNARITIPEEKAYIFSTELARETFIMNARQAVAFKIEENVPVNPSSSVYDFSVLPTASKENVQVSVTVVPRETIDAYVNAFTRAGILVTGVQTQNQAVAKAVIPNSENDTVILVNAHDGITDISVVSNHVVVYSSTVSSKDVDVVERVNRVLVFWQGRSKTHEGISNPKWVYLSGAEAGDPKLSEALSRGIDIPVKQGNVWVNCFSFDSYVPAVEKARSHAFAGAIGLAMPVESRNQTKL